LKYHINLFSLMLKLWIIRHRSKSLEHGYPGFRIASTNEGYRSSVAKYLPITPRTLYCRRWSGAFESFTGDQTVVGQVEWHGNKVYDLAHVSSGILSADIAEGTFSGNSRHSPLRMPVSRRLQKRRDDIP